MGLVVHCWWSEVRTLLKMPGASSQLKCNFSYFTIPGTLNEITKFTRAFFFPFFHNIMERKIIYRLSLCG